MKTNLDKRNLENIAQMAKDIREWLSSKDHPEHYLSVKDVELTRSFLHTLDLLETVLVRFEISTYFARQALDQLGQSAVEGSLAWEFWQTDVEEFFASNLLELCYQLSNAWAKLQRYADKETAFSILGKKYQKPGDILLARHKATHFVSAEFEDHPIAQQYSILRRPYRVVDGRLEKELAKFTGQRVAALLNDAVTEGFHYLDLFRAATVD